VNWLWLSGVAVALFYFIMNVLNVPQTIAANWQLVRSAVRRVRRPKRPAPSAVVAVPKVSVSQDEATAAPAPTRYLPPPPRVMLRPDYRYSGGAVDASAVMNVGPFVITQPDNDHLPSLSALFGSGPTAAGSAATA
jgi:hypothetical protein